MKFPRSSLLAALALSVASTTLPSVVGKQVNRAFLPQTKVAFSSEETTAIAKPQQPAAAIVSTTPRGGDINAAKDPLFGPLAFIVLNEVFAKAFKAAGVDFPAPLGGCMILFGAMVIGQAATGSWGDSVSQILNPGAGVLAKWLPVFFAPAMVAFPLLPSMGGPTEYAKVIGLTALGACFTLYSTAFFVLGLRKLMGKALSEEQEAPAKGFPDEVKDKLQELRNRVAPKGEEAPAAPAKAFSDDFMDTLLKAAVTTGIASIAANKLDIRGAPFLETFFLTISAIATFVYGSRLPAGFRAVIHPTLVATALSSVLVFANGKVTGKNYMDALRAFKTGSVKNLSQAGAGDLLFYMLGPAVVSFSQSMYSRRNLLVDNLLVVASGILFGSLGALFATAAFAKWIVLGGNTDATLRLSVLARSVTAPLAVVVSDMLGGSVGITAAVVVMTGISVASFGQQLLDLVGIKDPVARGMGQGAAGQSLGTAAMSSEPEAFPFAAMTFVFMAVVTTCITTIPFMKDLLVDVATAGMQVAAEAASDAA